MARQVDIVLTLNAAGVVTGGKAGKAGLKGIEQQAKQTEKALGRVGKQGRRAGDQIGRTMRSGRAGALSLNRIVQDLPFGFIAIQNNVTELAASFTVMKQNGLSGGEAIKAILAQFKGPGGFLFIISAAVALITAFGGKIVEAFNKGKTSAKELTEALDTLLTITRDLDKFEIAAEDTEAKLLVTREFMRATLDDITKILSLAGGATINLTEAQRETLKIERERLAGLKALEAELVKAIKDNKALAIQQEVLDAVGAKLVVEEKKITKARKTGTAAIKEEITELEKLQVELSGLRALSFDEAIAIETATRNLERQIGTRRSLITAMAEQAEIQAFLSGAGAGGPSALPVRGQESPLGPSPGLVGTEGIDAQIDATQRLIDIQHRRAEAALEVRDAEVAVAESAVLSAAAAVEAGDNVLQATLGVVRDIITARLAESIAGAVASSSIFGPIAGAAAGALMAVLFNQLMPSGHKSSSGGSRARAADTTSTLGVGLGGIRVQDRGFTTGATGAAASARAQTVTIRVIEPDLFKLNTELSNADGVRAQVGSV